jgi:hypothetical protein
VHETSVWGGKISHALIELKADTKIGLLYLALQTPSLESFFHPIAAGKGP